MLGACSEGPGKRLRAETSPAHLKLPATPLPHFLSFQPAAPGASLPAEHPHRPGLQNLGPPCVRTRPLQNVPSCLPPKCRWMGTAPLRQAAGKGGLCVLPVLLQTYVGDSDTTGLCGTETTPGTRQAAHAAWARRPSQLWRQTPAVIESE